MSPRTDSYLTLCLEQASKSPLHYRHGCIIVRGGKVIGQGYNDYRPGFNGGALKTGRLSSRGVLSGPDMAELKQRKKQKKEHISEHHPNRNTTATFTPFENPALSCSGGGGHLANTPLSMHSEMAAIYCALSLSNTLASQGSARSAKYFEKPCHSLQNSGKRGKARLRGLKKYVAAICEAPGQSSAQTGTGQQSKAKFQVQESRFEPNTSQPGQGQGAHQQGGQGGRGKIEGEQWGETPNEEGERVPSRSFVSSWPSHGTTTATTTAST